MRLLSYAQAIREAHAQLLENDPRVFVFGQGLYSPWYAGSSLLDIDIDYGRERVIDSPVSENATTGAAIGAAIVGMRPIVFHPRMDFMLLAVDPIVNQAANWSYLFAGKINVPIVIRAVINRGGEQGAQHSQALQAMFMHIPGLKVVMPSTPYDAKGLLIAAVNDGNPVIYIDDRWLYEETGHVPEEMYQVPIGSAQVMRKGEDISIVATSHIVSHAMTAAGKLETQGIHAEVINLRSIKPWDQETVLASVRKTGRIVIADAAWATGGIAAEIGMVISSILFSELKSPVQRVTLPDAPAPIATAHEKMYYPDANSIVKSVKNILN
ncbi:MAG: transketolase C-terminal domain-containing protein [Candidatus Latescibacteria bacterium]|nr:transketolase C-terminal domain-containing protein [Candidatus Latescibacterota bacterium]